MLVKGEQISLDGIERVLLIQLGDIGDVVLTIPTIKALRENRPAGTLYVMVREHAKELIEDYPYVNGVISVEGAQGNLWERLRYQRGFLKALRGKKFQAAIDLRTGTRGAVLSYLSGAPLRIGRYAEDGRLWRNRLFTHLVRPENEMEQYSSLHSLNIVAPFKVGARDIKPKLTVSRERELRTERILRDEGVPSDRPLLAFHPFSRWRYKEWPAQNYIALIDHVGSRYPVHIAITGSVDERGRAADLVKETNTEVYNLAGKTTIGELAGVLKKCNLVIGIDSATIHIAAAVGTPTVSIYGPSAPVNWAPLGEQHLVIFKDLPCVPCRQKGCNHSGVSRCLQELEVGEVIEVLDKKISEILEPTVDD
ncbi:MAG: lipopolysaccharide heptosyltransferase II [Deltaproteobacteria bacterium]|nr:lipopolysaccharide heptosyltransferase II [Deltaproteobacteria bacterium]MBW2076206.1 lipopolysaccharide heptosyltransferase II [Deltaproteobacteria bacterium]